MRYRNLGTSGIEASVVGLGTWAIGGWMWGGSDEKAAIAAIQRAVDEGMNLVDTAPVYGFGRSEELIGKALQGRRDRAVLATKCGLIWHKERGKFNFASDEKHPRSDGTIKVYRCLAPAEIRYEVEESLARLKTDYIDLYQTHWQDPTTPIAETMQTLMDLKTEGKIRAVGCSNATCAEMDAYRAAGQLDADQEPYSMLARRHEEQNLPHVARNDVAFLAYSPLAQGLLTGKIGPDREFEEGDQRRNKKSFSVENRRRVRALLSEFQPVADAHKITLGQLAIAWTVAQHGCSHALAGARTAEQVVENAAAGSVELTADEQRHMQNTIDAFLPDEG